MKIIENKKLRVLLTDEEYQFESEDTMTQKKLSDIKIRENILTYASSVVEARHQLKWGEITKKTELTASDIIAILCAHTANKLIETDQFRLEIAPACNILYWKKIHNSDESLIAKTIKASFSDNERKIIEIRKEAFLEKANKEYFKTKSRANSKLFKVIEEK